jgi:hypothetical protein
MRTLIETFKMEKYTYPWAQALWDQSKDGEVGVGC